ncbi:hypothetical protein F441_14683, partial [Phytophthora nicotianae CJ01A1]
MAKPLVSNSQAVLSVVKPEVPLASRTIAVQTNPVMVNVGTQTDFPDNDTQDASSTLVKPACSDRASERCAASQVAGVSEVLNDDTSSDEEPDALVHETSGRAVERLESEYARVMQVTEEDLKLEPGVFIHEGSELMAQLRDQLSMLPELQDL